ncbi:tigger transposable element-derived protein 1-like [Megalops cyprinoides]|uniref:tigger transposable element-derived protein 1-like n=1 Tax=Megalops cyprinoides TaxID=118141 RepID=UPI001864623F|nr:tigger transposable element-derived protein 1-like [Megalops cyprinoides]
MKYKIIQLSDNGNSNTEIARKLGLPRTTVVTILKDKARILEEVKSHAPMQAAYIRQRSGLIAETEKILKVWIDDQTRRRVPVSLAVIQATAKNVFEQLKERHGGGSHEETFQASKGWFYRFKSRFQLHNIKCEHGEAPSAEEEPVGDFPRKLAAMVKEGGYCARTVFNVDQTGLFWKKMPSRTYISKQENSTPGFKAAMDRLTVLLAANAAGDFRLKPLLVHHAETPRALQGYARSSLPAIWKSNPKALVTSTVFEEWFSVHFVPAVKEYCQANSLAFKVMLILDNAPSHSVSIEDFDPNIKVVFLPPNTTSLLQPMEQGVMSLFKAYYLRQTFAQAISAADKEDAPTLKEFWKSYNILDAVKNIATSWKEIKQSKLNGVWWNLCPEFVTDLHGLTDTVEDVTENVVRMAGQLQLEVTAEDVTQLLASHSQELSDEDLLQLEQQRLEEEEKTRTHDSPPRAALSTKVLSEAFKHFEAGMALLEENDPNFERSSTANEIIRSGYACYREIYREKKKAAVQTSLEMLFRVPAVASNTLPKNSPAESRPDNDSDEPGPSSLFLHLLLSSDRFQQRSPLVGNGGTWTPPKPGSPARGDTGHLRAHASPSPAPSPARRRALVTAAKGPVRLELRSRPR